MRTSLWHLITICDVRLATSGGIHVGILGQPALWSVLKTRGEYWPMPASFPAGYLIIMAIGGARELWVAIFTEDSGHILQQENASGPVLLWTLFTSWPWAARACPSGLWPAHSGIQLHLQWGHVQTAAGMAYIHTGPSPGLSLGHLSASGSVDAKTLSPWRHHHPRLKAPHRLKLPSKICCIL